jgi:histidine phosphotransfer protein HptB
MNPPINLEYLHQISDGDEEFELELLNLFVEDAVTHLDAAKLAIAATDYHNLEREAHHLKGSSGNVGAEQMHAIASALEQQALKSLLDGATDKISLLEAHLQTIKAFIDTYGK